MGRMRRLTLGGMRSFTGLVFVVSFAAAGACSSSGDKENGAGPDGGNSGGASNDGSTGPTPGRGLPVTSVTTAGTLCASQSLGASVLDIFIRLDKSASMDDPTASGRSKWDVITRSLVTFVNDPKSAGIGTGLGFFGLGSGT